MFEFVRSHNKLLQILLFVLFLPSFVFFGVQGYTRFGDDSAVPIASVDGRSILRGDWDKAHRQTVERLRQQMPKMDLRLLESPELRQQTLDALIRDRVLLAAASGDHLMPGDERLARLFRMDPQMQGLRNADGTVNRALLEAQGMSSEAFALQLRQEYGARQVLGMIEGTARLPDRSTGAAIDAFLQRRDVQWQLFATQDYSARIQPSQEEIQAHFKTHAQSFQRPESAQIEYVVLDLASVRKSIAVADDDLRRYYAENESRYTVAEERRASHILLKAEKDAPAAQRQQARERADALLAEVRRSPARFADLARQHSQDPGSAARGGDLDFFARGAMVKPFEDAVFAMKKGEISPIVETDFGFHIIQLSAVRGGEKRPFETVRKEIEDQFRQTAARSRFAESAEQFTNLVFEQPDSLKPVMDRFGLEKKAASVGRSPAPGAQGPLSSTKLLDALFSNDSIANKRNTEAIDLGDNQLVSARVVQHVPARVPELSEVMSEVREAVIKEQAAAQARRDGQARLQALKAAPQTAVGSAGALPRSAEVSRSQPQGLPRRVVDAILQAPAQALPVVLGIDMEQEGYAVVRITKVLAPDEAKAAREVVAPQLSQAWGAAESALYFESLKRRFKVEIKPAAGSSSKPST